MRVTIEGSKNQIESMLNTQSTPISKAHVLDMLNTYKHNLKTMLNNYEDGERSGINPDYIHDHNFITSQLALVNKDIKKTEYNMI